MDDRNIGVFARNRFGFRWKVAWIHPLDFDRRTEDPILSTASRGCFARRDSAQQGMLHPREAARKPELNVGRLHGIDRWDNQVWVQVQTSPVCEGPLCWQGWRRYQCDRALSQLQGRLLAGVWDQNRLALLER